MREKETLKVKLLEKDLYTGEHQLRLVDNASDWVDLRAETTYTIRKGDFVMIGLGVAIQLPRGYEALLIPRSSLFGKHGLIQTDGIGLVDETYCGDSDKWWLPVLATKDTIVEKGDRICQFRIIRHQPILHFEYVDELNNTSRGGFGSTGNK